MKVIIYIAVFFAITAILGIGGALVESERLDEVTSRIRSALTRGTEGVLSVVLYPIEAAVYYMDRRSR